MHAHTDRELDCIWVNAGESPPDWRQAAEIGAEFAVLLQECNLAIPTDLVYSGADA
jgi:hypothetical protein